MSSKLFEQFPTHIQVGFQQIFKYIIKSYLEPEFVTDYDVGFYELLYLFHEVEDFTWCLAGLCKQASVCDTDLYKESRIIQAVHTLFYIGELESKTRCTASQGVTSGNPASQGVACNPASQDKSVSQETSIRGLRPTRLAPLTSRAPTPWTDGRHYVCKAGLVRLLKVLIDKVAPDSLDIWLDSCLQQLSEVPNLNTHQLDVVYSLLTLLKSKCPKYKIDWLSPYSSAYKGGNLKLISLFRKKMKQKKRKVLWYFPLLKACSGGQLTLVKQIIGKARTQDGGLSHHYCHQILEHAYEGGNIELIEYVKQQLGVDFNDAEFICYASDSGNLDLITSLIKIHKNSINWDGVLYGVCSCGKRQNSYEEFISFIKLIIELIQTNGGFITVEGWNAAFSKVCKGTLEGNLTETERRTILRFFMKKGATECFWCTDELQTHFTRRIEAIPYFIKEMNN